MERIETLPLLSTRSHSLQLPAAPHTRPRPPSLITMADAAVLANTPPPPPALADAAAGDATAATTPPLSFPTTPSLLLGPPVAPLPGLEAALRALAKAALTHRPANVVGFGAAFFRDWAAREAADAAAAAAADRAAALSLAAVAPPPLEGEEEGEEEPAAAGSPPPAEEEASGVEEEVEAGEPAEEADAVAAF